jgi:hypothetical protein
VAATGETASIRIDRTSRPHRSGRRAQSGDSGDARPRAAEWARHGVTVGSIPAGHLRLT